MDEAPTATLPHPMDSIRVRRLRFDFATLDASAAVWSRSSPEFSIFINALGIHVPHFERYLVAVLRSVRGDIADEALRKDVQAIIGQEAHHAFNFEAWTKRLIERYPGVAALDRSARGWFEAALERHSRKFKVGFVAGYETFTFLGGMFILNRYDELMADADPTLRALWVWHQVEEVEHGAVAFDVYKAFYGECEWYRRAMVLLAFGHIAWETFRAYRQMMGVEGYHRSLRGALSGWGFFIRQAWELASGALPVLHRGYHPRQHPMCNHRQNRIAIAWRAWDAAGGNTLQLDDQVIAQMLQQAPAH